MSKRLVIVLGLLAGIVVLTSSSSATISLSARGFLRAGDLHTVELTWSGATKRVRILRDGATIARTANDGHYTDNLNATGAATYTYQVCEGTKGVCSNEAVVSFSGAEPSPSPTPTPSPTPSPTPTPTSDVVVTAAGDIACASPAVTSGTTCHYGLTADLIGQVNPTAVLALGDNQYPDGTLATYNTYYGPTWGVYKSKTMPVPGNHEYHIAGASGYFSYFNNIPPYYSYNLGSWHLIALNSEIPRGEGSAQNDWLEADLAANTQPCILAYWHNPLFSSGSVHGGNSSQQPFWDDLYATGADIVLAGHDHTYERFALQNPTGVADPSGIRQFVVGTGGKQHYGFGTIQPNSEVRNSDTFGVLKLTLRSSSYEWTFLPEAGKTFSDGGTNACH